MAHSLKYQIGESIHTIETEVGRLLDVVDALKEAGGDELAETVLAQAHKILEAAIALRIAAAG
ncbi:hypothetical protein [Pseudomonas fluorescens]|uniref:hypothetical protein n=1 Tax=Pseudomonas fluorescens TaxID=294 RepID=UPI001242A5BF|nr:hypothetical protein [Pseudomonas fluorescens]VVN10811.1 hypothetical protein PS639_03777 [Pseudomonas fluorescens]